MCSRVEFFREFIESFYTYGLLPCQFYLWIFNKLNKTYAISFRIVLRANDTDVTSLPFDLHRKTKISMLIEDLLSFKLNGGTALELCIFLVLR